MDSRRVAGNKVTFYHKIKGINNAEIFRRVQISFAEELNDVIVEGDYAENTHMDILLNYIDDDADGNYINSSENGTLLDNDTDSTRTESAGSNAFYVYLGNFFNRIIIRLMTINTRLS